MQHSAKKAALAQAGAQQLGNGQQLPAPVWGQTQGPGQAAAVPQTYGAGNMTPGITQQVSAPRQQQHVLLSPQQMLQHQQSQQLLGQQQAAQQQQAQNGQQLQQTFQGHAPLQQQQHQQQRSGGMANGVLPHSAPGQPPMQQLQQPYEQRYPQQQPLQAYRSQQPASSMRSMDTLLAPAAAAQFSYPAAPTAPPHLVNMHSSSGLPPVRSPTFGGPAPGRTLAEQHFRSTDPSALQAVAAQVRQYSASRSPARPALRVPW
jgi:hypothetical protein